MYPVVARQSPVSFKEKVQIGQKVMFNLIRLKGMPSCNQNVGSKPFYWERDGL